MAVTDEGKKLTEAHRQEQIRLAGVFERAASQYRGMVDPDDIDASFARYYAVLDRLTSAGYEVSASKARKYVLEFARAEVDADVDAVASKFSRDVFSQGVWIAGNYYPKRLIRDGVDARTALARGLGMVEDTVARTILDAGRNTIIGATRGLRYNGRRSRWRRVTDGQPCAFCAMLAGRGPVYVSEEAALRSHDKCGCSAEIVFTDWQPNEQEALWRASYLRAAKTAEVAHGRGVHYRKAKGEGQILFYMRRNDPLLYHDGVFPRDSVLRSPAYKSAFEGRNKRRASHLG